MEKIIVTENEFIEREKYQRIKKEMNKTDDWFNPEEMEQFTNIYRNSGEI